jgi:phage FluMu protein Com
MKKRVVNVLEHKCPECMGIGFTIKNAENVAARGEWPLAEGPPT